MSMPVLLFWESHAYLDYLLIDNARAYLGIWCASLIYQRCSKQSPWSSEVCR